MNKFSFSTGGLYPLKSEDALSLIKKAGFDYAELMPQCFSDLTFDFANKVSDIGIKVASIHYPLIFMGVMYSAQAGMVEDAKKFNQNLVDVAEKMGTEVIVLHPHKIEAEKDKSILETPIYENIMRFADMCEKSGITVAMENSPKGPGSTAEELLEYMKLFSSNKIIKPMVDTTESCEAFYDPVEFIKKVDPCHLHLSDFKGNTKHLPAGQGDIDWQGVKEALTGYKGYYTLEPVYRYYLTDIENKLRDANKFINELILG